MDKQYWHKLWVLFFTFAKIAALVVGGGYAILPVVEETFAKKYRWVTDNELLDMMGLVQTIPGLIACNSAVYVGMKVAGVGGALAGAFGVCLPSVAIIMLIAAFFPDLNPQNPILQGAFAGVRACITGLVIVSAFRMAKKVLKSSFDIAVTLICLIVVLMKVSPVYVILSAMPIGILYAWFKQRKNTAPEENRK